MLTHPEISQRRSSCRPHPPTYAQPPARPPTCVGHREDAGALVAQLEVLVGKLLTCEVRSAGGREGGGRGMSARAGHGRQVRAQGKHQEGAARAGTRRVPADSLPPRPPASTLPTSPPCTLECTHARTVDGLAAGAIAVGEVAALDHELRDDAVELGALEV